MPKPVDDRIPKEVPPLQLPEFEYDSIEKQERIGIGGDSVVYRATIAHQDCTYQIALKELRFDEVIQEQVVEKIQDEVETWSRLSDQNNIVSVYGWGAKPLPWLALEFMDGGTLDTRIGSLDLAEALWLAGRIAEAIQYGHRNGIAHFDIKPTNVLLRDTRRDKWDYPKVSDWGLTRMLVKHSDSIGGISPAYAAPEQFDEDFGSTSFTTDIYQLGALVYALVAGKPPFTGSSKSVMQGVLQEDPDPPSKINSDVPAAVDSVVLKALSKQKDDRYDNISSFSQKLDNLFGEYATGELDTTTSPRVSSKDESTDETAEKRSGSSGNKTDADESEDSTPVPQTGSSPAESNEKTSSSQSPINEANSSESPRVSRRHAVEILGLGVLASGGWMAMELTDTSNGSQETTDTTDSPTEDSAETDSDADSDADSDPDSPPITSVSEMFHYDLQNTGRVASDVGRRAGLSIEWEFTVPGGTISSTPVTADETVYVGCDDSNLYAVDGSSGEQQWHFKTGGSVKSSPALVNETIYIGSDDRSIYAIDTSGGDEMWSFETDRAVVSSPKVKDGTVFIGSNDGSLYALESQTGEIEWSYDTGAAIQSTPAVDNSTIYVGNDDGDLYALDLADGQVSWTFDEPIAAVTAAPVVDENTVYLGVERGYTYAIDLESKFKNEKWRYSTKAGVTGSPALGDDRLYIPDNGNRLTAVNTSDGSEAWTAEVVDGITTPATLGDRSVYVGHGTDGGANVLSLFTTGESDSDDESDSSTVGQQAVSVTIGYRVTTAPLLTSDKVIVGTDGASLVAASSSF